MSVVHLSIGGLGLVSNALAQQTLYIDVTDTHLPSGIAGRCMDADRLPDGERNHFTIQVVDLEGDGDIDILAPALPLAGSLDYSCGVL